jgi:hypothetical protein
MDVLGKILTPAMEYGGHAQLTPQAFGVCRKNLERFPSGLEQTSVYHLWMRKTRVENQGQNTVSANISKNCVLTLVFRKGRYGVAERLVGPGKPGNAGGGKGP